MVTNLSYTNGELGACEISGDVPGTLAGTFDECGGSQTVTWTFTDDCNRTITHVQTITIDPAPMAAFINPPGEYHADVVMRHRTLWSRIYLIQMVSREHVR